MTLQKIVIEDIRHTIYKPIPLQEAIRGTLLNALAYTSGNQTEAAELLGVSTRMLSYQLRVKGIPGAMAGIQRSKRNPATTKRKKH